MTHALAIAWLAMAAFDKPIDPGSLLYVGMSVWSAARAMRG